MDVFQISNSQMPVPATEIRHPLQGDSAHSHPSILVDYSSSTERRREIEQFIRDEYREHFGANLTHFMPHLLALHRPCGAVRAVVGYRGAQEELFLETYTRKPIEQVIAERLGETVPRHQIVEVGSLACRDGRAAVEIIKAVIPNLIQQGFTWVVLTGADTVRNVFRRLDLEPRALCVADKSLLGDDQDTWGTYYDHHPIVMAGRLADGICALDPVPGVQ